MTVGEMKCLCSEVAAQVSPGKTQEQQSGRMKGHQRNMFMKASFLLLQTNVQYPRSGAIRVDANELLGPQTTKKCPWQNNKFLFSLQHLSLV